MTNPHTPNPTPMTPLITVTPKPIPDDEHARTQRQQALPGMGEHTQQLLAGAKILIIGAGGLGCPAATALTAAGVGHLTLADGDTVSISNLHRQTLFRHTDIGREKTTAAAEALAGLSCITRIDTAPGITADNALPLINNHDLVIDATDNFATRYLIADACEITHTPLVWAAILRNQAQLSLFAPGHTHLRDIFPNPPAPGNIPSCAQAGVLATTTGTIGNLMAAQAITAITGIGSPATNKLILIDTFTLTTRTLTTTPDPTRTPPVDLSAHRTNTPIDRAGITTLIDQGHHITLLDVRDTHERAHGTLGQDYPHLTDHHRPLKEVENGGLIGLEDLTTNDGHPNTLIIYCASGTRAARAADALQEQAEAHNLTVRVFNGTINHQPTEETRT